jgi:hypothetical protein
VLAGRGTADLLICQEALTNAVRHGAPQRIVGSATAPNRSPSASDDGRASDPAQAERGRPLRRAQHAPARGPVRGRLTIASSPATARGK